ncbi:MAG: chemotaxis protein CheX [candidate division Zixibacteria bacterium]|nr:chemotaxis protein CheX [candidate division Zixibacteria bacterium]
MKSLSYITSRDNPPADLGRILEKYGQLTSIVPDGSMPSTVPDIVLVEDDIISDDSPLPEAIKTAQTLGIPIVLVNVLAENNSPDAKLSEIAYGMISRPFLPETVESVLQSLPDRALMTKIISSALQAVIYVLETTTGSSVRQNQDATPPIGDDKGYCGSVPLSGDVDGTLTVLLPYNLAVQTAARILGCDSSKVKQSWIRDGVGEITNQVAGRLRTELSHEGRDIVIAIPEVKESKPWHWTKNGLEDSFYLECLGYQFILQLSIRIKVKAPMST